MFRILHLSDLHARQKSVWSTLPILKEAIRIVGYLARRLAALAS